MWGSEVGLRGSGVRSVCGSVVGLRGGEVFK